MAGKKGKGPKRPRSKAPSILQGPARVQQQVKGGLYGGGTTRTIEYRPLVIEASGMKGKGGTKKPRYRAYAMGPRGGLQAQTKWGMDAIIKNIPGAAIATVGFGAGLSYLKAMGYGDSISKKLPGGTNTLALITGAGIGYLGYKYRWLIGFLGGAGIAAYALVKLGTKEANLKMESETTFEELPEGGGVILDEGNPPPVKMPEPKPAPAPAPAPAPSALDAAKRLMAEGNKQFASGDYLGALAKYKASQQVMTDPIQNYNIARANHKLAEEANSRGDVDSTIGFGNAAVKGYEFFLLNLQDGTASKMTDAGTLQQLGQQAAVFKSNLQRNLAPLERGRGGAEPEQTRAQQPRPEALRGVELSGDDLDDDDDDMSGDEYDDDDDE